MSVLKLFSFIVVVLAMIVLSEKQESLRHRELERQQMIDEIEQRTLGVIEDVPDQKLKKKMKKMTKLMKKFANGKIEKEDFESDLEDLLNQGGDSNSSYTDFISQISSDLSIPQEPPTNNNQSTASLLGICFSCPLCAIFAAPLSLTWPLLDSQMQGRCQNHGPLTPSLRGLVGCHFPTLNLDQIQVYWGCQYLNEKVIFGKSIGLVPDGQTFDNHIYLDQSGPNDGAAKIVIHELRHTQQYKNAGGLIKFGYNYLYHFCRKGFSYRKIDEEVDAYNFANARSVCPPTPAPIPTTRAPTRAPVRLPSGVPCVSPSQCQSGLCSAGFRQLLPVGGGDGGGGGGIPRKRCE